MPIHRFTPSNLLKLTMGGASCLALLAACDPGSQYDDYVAPFGDWTCLMRGLNEATLLDLTMGEDFSFQQLMRASTDERVLMIKSSGDWIWEGDDLTFNMVDVSVDILLTENGKAELEEQGESVEGLIKDINDFFATQDEAKSQTLVINEMRDEFMVLNDRGSTINCTR